MKIYSDNVYVNVMGSIDNRVYANSQMAGLVRFNINDQQLETYDGTNWRPILNSTINISLSHHALTIMKWAEKKMIEEAEIDGLIKNNPGLADLRDQFITMLILAKKNDDTKN